MFASRFTSKIDEVNHLLLAVWGEGIYLEQIEDIIDHYGNDTVREAELMLYNTTIFKLIVE